MSEGKTTTDHDVIRSWVEERKGRPSRLAATADKQGGGLLRIDFGEPEEGLEEISWDDFFRTFDKNRLNFLYQEKTADGKLSRFHKFIDK
ncbi:hypothetical protein ACFPL7_05425 [Dongia soli]|uniref:1,4-alpha-glucan branching enzyme n=1 Tax=Dongia soli TaxID=600628 RepID=A0ABU5EH74_9PROT|nr:hypothetical protein [Dongia soli]MDY0884840.1 hypothetical protein [Dongia soli]